MGWSGIADRDARASELVKPCHSMRKHPLADWLWHSQEPVIQEAAP